MQPLDSDAPTSATSTQRSKRASSAVAPSHNPSAVEYTMEVFTRLIRTSETFSALLQRELQAVGLTTSQLGVMETLHHDGPMCQRDIGEKLNKSRGNITTVVDNLERRKLVKRVRNKDDRRYITLHLTEKGRLTVEEIFPLHAERVANIMGALSEDDLQALQHICDKLDGALHQGEDED